MSNQVDALRDAVGAVEYAVSRWEVPGQDTMQMDNDDYVRLTDARHLVTALQFMRQQHEALIRISNKVRRGKATLDDCVVADSLITTYEEATK